MFCDSHRISIVHISRNFVSFAAEGVHLNSISGDAIFLQQGAAIKTQSGGGFFDLAGDQRKMREKHLGQLFHKAIFPQNKLQTVTLCCSYQNVFEHWRSLDFLKTFL